jgi:tRNA nucleotidyltransferase/poly(A) polymerase
MRAVDSWVHTGLTRADRLHAHAHTLLVLWEKWALKLDIRRRLLRLIQKFYIDSSNAFAVLDSLDKHLSSNNLRSSEELIHEYNQINEQLIQSTEIPLRQGQILLEKSQINDYNCQFLRERVYDLEKRIEQIRNKLKQEYEKLDQQGSSLYQKFDNEYTTIQSWLYNVNEHFLNSNRYLIDLNNNINIRKQANDFFESHQQIIEHDLKVRIYIINDRSAVVNALITICQSLGIERKYI